MELRITDYLPETPPNPKTRNTCLQVASMSRLRVTLEELPGSLQSSQHQNTIATMEKLAKRGGIVVEHKGFGGESL